MDQRIEKLLAKGIPEYAIPKTRGSKKQSPANLLTSQVIEHMQELGGFALKRFQERIEKAGGVYLIARTFDQFKTDFQNIIKTI